MGRRPIKVPQTATHRLYKLAEEWAAASWNDGVADANDDDNREGSIYNEAKARKAFKAALATIETDAAALR